jgi:hypothetical protein
MSTHNPAAVSASGWLYPREIKKRQARTLQFAASRQERINDAPDQSQNRRAGSVQLPKPLATMFAMTVQTYLFWAGLFFGPA